MPNDKMFFYLKDIQPLIDEAVKAGGTELGIVIKPRENGHKKPKLHVSYIVKSNKKAVSIAADDEKETEGTDGCPYPPRCE